MSNEIQKHPDLEDLAAFADGLLPPAERLEVQAHLADCTTCYEVVSEVLHMMDESGDEAPASTEPTSTEESASHTPPPPMPEPEPANENHRPIVPLRRGYWPWAAAAAVAAALLAVLLWHPWESPRLPAAALVAVLDEPAEALRGRLGEDWATGVLPENRGDADDALVETVLYRSGVRLVQVELAWLAGDSQQAATLANQIAAELSRAGMIGPALLFFSDLSQRMASTANERVEREEILAAVREQAEWLADASPTYFRLGQWTEATRMAATLGAGDYFDRRHPRRDLDQFLAADLPSAIVSDLKKIRHELDGEHDPQRIAAACWSIHRLAGRI